MVKVAVCSNPSTAMPHERGGKKRMLTALWLSQPHYNQHINLSKPETFGKVCNVLSHRPTFLLLSNRNICNSGLLDFQIVSLNIVHLTAAVCAKLTKFVLMFLLANTFPFSLMVHLFYSILSHLHKLHLCKLQRISQQCWSHAGNSVF